MSSYRKRPATANTFVVNKYPSRSTPSPGRKTALNFAEAEMEAINPDEEKREIAVQLQLIRKMHDKAKQANIKKREEVEKLKQELTQLDFESGVQEDSDKAITDQLEHYQNSINIAKEKLLIEQLYKNSYEHMLVRMRSDSLALEIKLNKLAKTLDVAKLNLNGATAKGRKVTESRCQSRNALSNLRNEIGMDARKKEERILQMERNVRERMDAASRREDRQKRQAEMAENITTEDKDSQEVKMREALTVRKFYWTYLKKRLESAQKGSVHLEQAFAKIKAGTGIRDVDEIVERFLTKEKRFDSLLQDVNKAEQSLESLKAQHEKAQKELQAMTIMAGGKKREVYLEIEEIEEQLRVMKKDYTSTKDKLTHSVGIYDRLLDWGLQTGERLMGKNSLDLDIPSGLTIGNGKNTLLDLFQIIKAKVQEKLAPVLKTKTELLGEITKINKKDVNTVLDEVSSSDFLTKNVRVRPRSVKNFDSIDQSDDEDAVARLETRVELDEERQTAKQEAKEKEQLYRRRKRRQSAMRRYY